MAKTYEPISTTTLGTATATVTLSSIPQTYTDLVLVVSNLSAASASNAFKMQVNSDTGNNYSTTFLEGDGSTTESGRASSQSSFRFHDQVIGTNAYGITIANFMNYSNTTLYKTVMSRSNATGTAVEAAANLWRNTNAISSIAIFFATSGNNIQSGTVFTLYGIKAA